MTVEFLVTVTGASRATARWWVSGDAGWVGLGLNAGQVVMVPSSHHDIAQALLIDVAGAVAAGSA